MDKTEDIETWDKKKIAIAIVAVILLGSVVYLLKNIVVGNNKDFFGIKFLSSPNASQSIKGASTNKEDTGKDFSDSAKSSPLPLQATIKEKLDELKKEVGNLNVADIASSSPQMQRIINDLNSLRQYPVNEIQDICRKVCGL